MANGGFDLDRLASRTYMLLFSVGENHWTCIADRFEFDVLGARNMVERTHTIARWMLWALPLWALMLLLGTVTHQQPNPQTQFGAFAGYVTHAYEQRGDVGVPPDWRLIYITAQPV